MRPNTTNTQYSDGIYIALGSNQPSAGVSGGDLFRLACEALLQEQIVTRQVSSLWKTPAWPDPGQPSYFNAVIAVSAATDDPEHILQALFRVEACFGRVRTQANASRTLDLDLIDFRGVVRALRPASGQGALILPHVRAHVRRFVLLPLQELAPHWVHPVLGRSITDLLDELPDEGEIALAQAWCEPEALAKSGILLRNVDAADSGC